MHKKNWKRLLLIGTAILITVAALWRYMEYQHMKNPDRTHPAMEITSNPKPFCIGRVMVDLPQGLHLNNPDIVPHISSTLTLRGVKISTQTNISLEEFNQIVANRWAEVQTYTHDSYKDAYVKPSEHYKIKENAWILTFKHHKIESNVRRQPNGEVLYDVITVGETEGYLWDKGTMFTIKSKTNENKDNQRIANSMLLMRYMAIGEIPQEAGVCLNGGFIQSHYRSASEYLNWSMQLPQLGNLTLMFFTGTDVRDKSMVERNYKDISPTFSEAEGRMVSEGIVHRAAHRTEDPLLGDEVVITSAKYHKEETPRNYDTQVYAAWEFKGRKEPNPQPYVEFNLLFETKNTHTPSKLGEFPEKTETSTYPNKEEFLALWDAIVSTIRFYPGALTPAPAPPPKEVIPGPSAQKIAADRKALDDFLDEP